MKARCNRESRLRRFLGFFAWRRCELRLPEYWGEDEAPDSFVREPRRPKPFSPSTAAALDLPD